MIYAVSDIHGCFGKYQELLKKINFGPDDTLYFLGDAIDRGPDGFKVLLDMASRANVLPVKGNHEAMAMDVIPGVKRCLSQGKDVRTIEEKYAMRLWDYNGGKVSLQAYLSLSGEDSGRAWDYMASMPLYREAEAGGRKFVLVHGGLDNFSPSRPLSDYGEDELVWARPEPDTVYYQDKYVVVGHTPTEILYEEAESMRGKAEKKTLRQKFFRRRNYMDSPEFFRADTFIDIDCGCVFRNRLGCLCLDTMEEIYV